LTILIDKIGMNVDAVIYASNKPEKEM